MAGSPCWFFSNVPTSQIAPGAWSDKSYYFINTITGESAWIEVGERIGKEGHVLAESNSVVDCVRAQSDGGTVCVIPGPGLKYFERE